MKLIGFQGRALGSNSVKYITVMLDDNAPKIYGLDEINKDLPVYVVEGPFDSTFVNNSVRLCVAVMVTLVVLRKRSHFCL